jgi:hypothetical protein
MKYRQKILFFFCRPCGEYHEKTHPHYRAMKRRKRKAALAKLARDGHAATASDAPKTP